MGQALYGALDAVPARVALAMDGGQVRLRRGAFAGQARC
jgi:hypothetical protein